MLASHDDENAAAARVGTSLAPRGSVMASVHASHPKPLVLITGSSGLIGSRLSESLASSYEVVNFDLEPAQSSPPNATFIQCDLTDENALATALDRVWDQHGHRVASVVHLAAYYDFSGEDSPLYQELTVGGTRRLLRALRAFDVEQFVFTSSLLVMQPSPDGSAIDEQSPTEGIWPYPESKLETEWLIREERRNIPVAILRIAGVYDELGRSPAITEHIRRVHAKELTSYFFPGSPDHGQAFIHIDDAVLALKAVIDRRAKLGPIETFLISEPDAVPYEEFQQTLGEQIHGKEWPTLRIPKSVAKAGAWVQEKFSDGDEEPFIKPFMVDLADADYPVNIARAQRFLEWKPQHRLAEELPHIVEKMLRDPSDWYRSNGITPPEQVAVEAKHS